MSKDKIWRPNPAMTATRALRAQQKAMPMIGYLSSGSPTALFMAAFRWAEGHYDRLPDAYTDQDHKRPYNYELRPRACTKTPMWIRWNTKAFMLRPQEWHTPFSHSIGYNMHDTTK